MIWPAMLWTLTVKASLKIMFFLEATLFQSAFFLRNLGQFQGQ